MSTGAQVLVDTLAAEGVRQVYGIPGTTIMDVLDVLGGQDEIRYLSVRHEQGAAFMADGFSRASGEIGVCIGSRGPGITNMATAIANAHDESIPMLALVGQVADGIAERHAFEELDVVTMFGPITKWCVEVRSAARIPELVQRALRTARSGRPGPVVVSLPLDVLTAQVAEPVAPQPRVQVESPRPSEQAVRRVNELLAGARAPVIVAGGGLAHTAAGELSALAARFAAPVVTTWARKDRCANDDPAFVGVLGAGSLAVTDRAVREADVLLALGCRFSEFSTKRWTLISPQTQIAHVDIDTDELGRIYPPAVAVHADAASALHDLLAADAPVTDSRDTDSRDTDSRDTDSRDTDSPAASRRARLAELGEQYRRDSALPDDAGDVGDDAMTTARLAHALDGLLATRALTLVVDAPSTGVWVSRHLCFRPPATRYVASAGGAMGWGFPAALGMSLARPGETVVCLSGDGSFMMVANELETAVREGIPVVVVVANNFAYGNTRDRQRYSHGERYVGVFYDNPDLAAYARLLGAHGERVERASELGAALDRALDSGLPAVVDVIQDRFEGLPADARPLPPR